MNLVKNLINFFKIASEAPQLVPSQLVPQLPPQSASRPSSHDFPQSSSDTLPHPHSQAVPVAPAQPLLKPFNSNDESLYVELVLVYDNDMYNSFSRNTDNVHKYSKNVVNIVNSVKYRLFN